MSKWQRGAEISKNLIIVLVIIVLAAGGFWMWKVRGTSSEKSTIADEYAQDEYHLWCADCEKLSTLPQKEAQQWNRDKVDGKMKCPECGEYTVPKWGKAGGSVVDLDKQP